MLFWWNLNIDISGFADGQDFNGPIIFTFASASGVNESDVRSAIITFRQIAESKSEIIISTVQEPHLESNLVLTTLLIVG